MVSPDSFVIRSGDMRQKLRVSTGDINQNLTFKCQIYKTNTRNQARQLLLGKLEVNWQWSFNSWECVIQPLGGSNLPEWRP